MRRAFATLNRATSRIAVVDISGFSSGPDHSAARALSDAFADTGFAVVTGHGVPASTAAELRRAAFAWFSQDLDAKRRVNDGSEAGYGKSPYCYMEENGAQLLGDFSRPDDVVESLTYRGLGRPDVQASIPADLRDIILDHEQFYVGMRTTLRRACELGLGLQHGCLDKLCDSGSGAGILRLAHYPDLETPPADGQLRYGAHADSYGLTTLRLDSENPDGLQVEIDGAWVDVPYLENSIVLNVGAALSRWTHGFWRASIHRVLLRPGRRLSIVSDAVKPNPETVIDAIWPERAGAGLPPVLMQDFIEERVAMHRPSYLRELQIEGDQVQKVSAQIRSYER